MALAPGTRLGTYEVVEWLGAGGMGEVYRAHHTRLGRDVALKVLPAAVSNDADRVARFEREARAVAALSHPNILAIHDFGSDNGVHYAVTELLEGQTLRDLVHSGRVPVAKAVAITIQIARGLEAAHARGLVHRDLKPDNVFVLGDGQVKILDFGLAKTSSAEAESATTQLSPYATEAGMVFGTAGYMSPEQVRGGAVDHRADLFALGCILYELLTGRRAFQGDSSVDTLHATLHADPPAVTTLAGVPEPLARVVSRSLEKQPANRFQSSADLRFALDTIAETVRSSAPPPLAGPRPSPLWRIGVAAAVIAATAAGVWYGRGITRSDAPSVVTPQARGIAVLPFENLGEVDRAYFAAGVTEEVTLQLAKVSALRVIGRSAVARFKDPAAQLQEMARDLNIGAVVTGSVRHAGSQVRVGVQLLAAPSGETMWSEQYDRPAANIFDVQSDIAVRVARQLQASLAPDERARIQRVPTDNPAAYELYLQERRLAANVPEQNDQGITLLQKAIALDPKFALAYAVLAHRFVYKGTAFGRAEYLRGVEAGRTAVRLDPQLARGHFALGIALARAGQLEEGRLSMQRSIELDSNFGTAMQNLAILEGNAGRIDQAAYWAMRAWPLAPNVPHSYYYVSEPLVALDLDVAERWLAAAAARFKPDDPASGERIVRMQGAVALRRGDLATAVARARDAVRAKPDVISSTQFLTELATYAGTPDAEALVDAALEAGRGGRGIWVGYTPRTLRAYLYTRAGRPDLARPLIDAALDVNRKAIAEGDETYAPWYESVSLHMMRGERAAALDAWERAVEVGFHDDKIAVYDSLISPLKNEPRFVVALDRVKRRVAQMRARVDFDVIDEWIARGAPTTAVR